MRVTQDQAKVRLVAGLLVSLADEDALDGITPRTAFSLSGLSPTQNDLVAYTEALRRKSWKHAVLERMVEEDLLVKVFEDHQDLFHRKAPPVVFGRLARQDLSEACSLSKWLLWPSDYELPSWALAEEGVFSKARKEKELEEAGESSVIEEDSHKEAPLENGEGFEEETLRFLASILESQLQTQTQITAALQALESLAKIVQSPPPAPATPVVDDLLAKFTEVRAALVAFLPNQANFTEAATQRFTRLENNFLRIEGWMKKHVAVQDLKDRLISVTNAAAILSAEVKVIHNAISATVKDIGAGVDLLLEGENAEGRRASDDLSK